MSGHPLDVDLADLVDGALDAAAAERVEAHLADCLLCRLKRRRLLGAPPPAGGGSPLPSPHFVLPAVEEGGEPAAGDVWLAGADQRLLVQILGVAGDRVAVAPVTLDVGAADDEAPVTGHVVVYPALATDLPRRALTGRVVLDVSGEPAPGPPIAGPDDPRLELRQHLADALAALGDPPEAPPTGPVGPDHARSALIADLRAMRGRACTVRALDGWDDLVLAESRGWSPLATIDELGVVLVILDTPHGLADEGDFDAARAVLTRLNASALVVTTTALSDVADVFDAPALHAGIDLPAGDHTPPRPLISGLATFDAITKFLDQHSGARAMSPPTRGPVAGVDVADVLRQAAATAAADAARQGARFKIMPKRRGYESLAGADRAIAAALAKAFEGGSVVEALEELAGAGPERPPERALE